LGGGDPDPVQVEDPHRQRLHKAAEMVAACSMDILACLRFASEPWREIHAQPKRPPQPRDRRNVVVAIVPWR
jgi:hypothetical protein